MKKLIQSVTIASAFMLIGITKSFAQSEPCDFSIDEKSVEDEVTYKLHPLPKGNLRHQAFEVYFGMKMAECLSRTDFGHNLGDLGHIDGIDEGVVVE